MEADTDAEELQAALDAIAVAVTVDEVNASLDALDDHISGLAESSTRTLLKRALNALRAVDARKAS
jgi:transcriptional accessory protein Tex/SPT6